MLSVLGAEARRPTLPGPLVLPWPKKRTILVIEKSAVGYRRAASMREVAAVASRVRSRFRS